MSWADQGEISYVEPHCTRFRHDALVARRVSRALRVGIFALAWSLLGALPASAGAPCAS